MIYQILILKEENNMIRVGVIFGGETVEHEVSIISAIQAMNKMDTQKYEIVPIYITKDRRWYTGEILKEMETFQDLNLLKRYTKNVVLCSHKGRFILQSTGLFKREIKEIDIAFPIVHGTNVEDGNLQGYLATVGIPYVGASVAAAALGQDKVFQKQIWSTEDLSITNYVWFFDSEYNENKADIIKKVSKLKMPVIVKPANLGSSVGIEIAHDKGELAAAIEDAITYDSKILVEEVVANLKEVNISVLGTYDNYELSVIEEVMSDNELLTYKDKYIGSSKKDGTSSKGMLSTARKIPANISSKMEKEVQELAAKSFKALGLAGNVRIDFLIDTKKNKVYINEVNTIPGSLAFYLWDPKGKDYSTLLDDMINIAVKEYKRKTSKTHSFESNILEGYNGLKGAKGLKGSKKI